MADDTPRAPQARTRLARRAVLDAAGTLFLERGYGATTIEAISRESDVPQATVYRLFSSKQGILKALVDMSVAGDDEPVPVADRPPVRVTADARDDPTDQLAGLAAVSVDINARTAPIYRILVERRRLRPGGGGAPRRTDTAAPAGPGARRDLAGPRRARCDQDCAPETPATSSTHWPHRSSTGCSWSTADGPPSVTSGG